MGRRTTDHDPTIERIEDGKIPNSDSPERTYFDWRTFDPSMLEGGSDAPLATELITYRDHLDELLKRKGQFVLIKGKVIVGYHPSRRAAVADAVARYGAGPVLIKMIVEKEPVHQIGHAII